MASITGYMRGGTCVSGQVLVTNWNVVNPINMYSVQYGEERFGAELIPKPYLVLETQLIYAKLYQDASPRGMVGSFNDLNAGENNFCRRTTTSNMCSKNSKSNDFLQMRYHKQRPISEWE